MTSCGGEQKQNESKATTDQQADAHSTPQTDQSASSFRIENIPVSDQDLGNFPFFSFPAGLEATNKPVERKFDRLFFAIDGKMMPLEGHVWKTYVSAASGTEWSLPFFEKSYDEAIKAVGGVKIFDGTITADEYKRYSPQAPYLGEDGSIGYTEETIKTYVIHRPKDGDVYIQLTGNNASGKLNIIQLEGFKQTISILKSDEIKKELDDKGKSILHINFDTDKATLKPEGKDAVTEIVKVLQGDNALKLAINGYTDTTGDNAHNLQLSKDRALAVLNAIVSAGIDKSRLSSNGFGSAEPIADNTTEDGKAQNRRVELVKK
ncbi:hypothetical protein GCM10027347_20300 [Larkinella harenae]